MICSRNVYSLYLVSLALLLTEECGFLYRDICERRGVMLCSSTGTGFNQAKCGTQDRAENNCKVPV